MSCPHFVIPVLDFTCRGIRLDIYYLVVRVFSVFLQHWEAQPLFLRDVDDCPSAGFRHGPKHLFVFMLP